MWCLALKRSLSVCLGPASQDHWLQAGSSQVMSEEENLDSALKIEYNRPVMFMISDVY